GRACRLREPDHHRRRAGCRALRLVTLMHVATAQLPEIEDSDDKIYITPNAVIMLDGASAFVPVPVPASTFAAQLGQRLRDTLTAQPDAALPAALGEAISDTAHTLQLQPGESPSSTVTIARQTDDHID